MKMRMEIRNYAIVAIKTEHTDIRTHISSRDIYVYLKSIVIELMKVKPLFITKYHLYTYF